jgi:integrase
VNLPGRSHVEKRFLSVEELHDLADTIDPRHRTLVLTAGCTGARFGELAALHPRDLDLARRRVTITRSLAEVRGVITETEPRTAASKRSITLPQAVVDGLTAHLDHHATGRTDQVFTAPQGGPLRRRSFRRRFWLPAVKGSVGQPMRFHDLRRTHAALLIADDRLEQLIADAVAHRTRTERGLEL